MKFNNNEEAVSPVIGVILMVAITVILAAVIAVFVFGMADDIQTSHTVAATAKVADGYVLITFQGGPDAKDVANISASLYNTTTNTMVTGSTTEVGNTVGNTVSIAKGVGDRVVVTATFNDGASQVLLDKQI